MITIANATMDDLTYVASWLSDVDRTELSITRDVNDYDRLATDAYLSPYCKMALLDGMTPVFAFGARPIDAEPDLAQVWGFKTPLGPKAVRTVTKYLLRELIPSLRMNGICRAVCYVHVENHGSRRWLAHLGFHPSATPGETGTPLMLYQRDDRVDALPET